MPETSNLEKLSEHIDPDSLAAKLVSAALESPETVEEALEAVLRFRFEELEKTNED